MSKKYVHVLHRSAAAKLHSAVKFIQDEFVGYASAEGFLFLFNRIHPIGAQLAFRK